MNQFKIFKSSAGSGKTFTLVKEYLRIVISAPEDYRHILAVTFTNKATAEMKSRIVEALIELSENRNSQLAEMISSEVPVENIQQRAQQALDFILHDYSGFSVMTIDSFFQQIIRNLAREIRLPLRMEVQMNQDEVIEEITSQLLTEVGKDAELTRWLSALMIQKLSDDKGWNIESDIENIARELFKEVPLQEQLSDREYIHDLMKQLRAIKAKFESAMNSFGEEGLKLIAGNGLSVADFSYGKSGVAGYFEKILSNKDAYGYKPGSRVLAGAADSGNWYPKKSPRKDEIQSLAESKLMPLLETILSYGEKEFPLYAGGAEVLKRIYVLGIIHDLRRKLGEYRTEKNMLIISDTPKILSEYINADDAPFIFEKTGNKYKHFLVDEFQDTSDLQWKNILPLIINSLGSGNFSMVVGDAKQSIYRWRGGNMNLLTNKMRGDLRMFNPIIREENLDTNYRSKKNVVEFNNGFFRAVPSIINTEIEASEHVLLHLAYSDDLIQHVPEKNNEGGYVGVTFIDGEENGKSEAGDDKKWKDIALEKMLETVKTALANNYSFRDIAILIRNNREGDEVAGFLFDHNIKKVVSPDSLLLWRSPKIRFILNVLLFLADNNNEIARSEILFYVTIHQKNNPETDLHPVFSDHHIMNGRGKKKSAGGNTLFDVTQLDDTLFNRILPEEFANHLRYLSKLPVYELCEQIISAFYLNEKADAYLQRFLDLVLEYISKNNASLAGFLAWWEESKAAQKVSLIIPENEDAIRITTIHKSKGLQFPIVIIPFADWKLLPDARDVMWVTSDVEPLKDFGKVPLNPSSKLVDTVFKDAYQKEMESAVIDNVNLLYVAFTRAEDELHIFCPENDSENFNSVGKLIRKVVESQFSVGNLQFAIGKVAVNAKKKSTSKEEIIAMKSFPSFRWQEKINIATHSGDLFEMLDAPASQKINYGILVHRILAGINTQNEISNAVDAIYYEGLISEEEKMQLTTEIINLLTVEEIKNFFAEDWKVKSEREIILPDGEILRPDRVIVKDNKAVVIDFKTGKESKAHENQVSRYADVLLQMGYDSVEKYLIYISERKLKRVV